LDKLNGGGGTFLAWPTTAASPQITMEIHISDWTNKFQNKTGLDAKAISELYKSNRVNSVWNTITTAFERDTGNEFSKKRLQSMWTRFNDEFRRDGDDKQSKEFNPFCAQTGSGKKRR
jgi:hypothetical protein